jgi:branched-chain amino acid aminotransferase
MEWSRVEEHDLTLEEAKRADAVFLSSSMRNVQGIERWDDHSFSPSRPVTQALATRFAECSEEDLDP